MTVLTRVFVVTWLSSKCSCPSQPTYGQTKSSHNKLFTGVKLEKTSQIQVGEQSAFDSKVGRN